MTQAMGPAHTLPRQGWQKCIRTVALLVVALAAPVRELRGSGSQEQPETPNAGGTVSQLPPRAILEIANAKLSMESLITAIAFSPDGRIVVATGADFRIPRAALFDVQSGRRIKLLIPPERAEGAVQCVDYSPDGSKLVWGEDGGFVALWDLTLDRVAFREKIHRRSVVEIKFSPDGSVFASVGEERSVQLRRTANPNVVVQWFKGGEQRPVRPGYAGQLPGRFPAGPFHLAFTPDRTRLVVGSESDATISVWQIRDGQLLLLFDRAHGDRASGFSAAVTFVAVTPDGRRIISAGASSVPIEQTGLRFGPKNVRLSEVRSWDIETGALVKNLHGAENQGYGYAALSRDGERVAVADLGSIRILNTDTGESEANLPLPGSRGGPAAFSPDRSLVAMPSADVLKLFDVRSGLRLHHDGERPEGSVVSAAWSSSGERIVTGHSEGKVAVWDAKTGALLWQKLLAAVIGTGGWSERPAFVTFSRDGRIVIAAGGRDDPLSSRNGGIVVMYEAADGRIIHELKHEQVFHGALGPDDRMLVVSTSRSGPIDNMHLAGVEVGTGQLRWANPRDQEQRGIGSVAAMQFRPSSPFVDVAVKEGNIIRFNSLTGREQRRISVDWRTQEQRKLHEPVRPYLAEATFSSDGSTLITTFKEWVCVWDLESGRMQRKFRCPHAADCRVTVSPDGKTLATMLVIRQGILHRTAIRLLDVESGALVLDLDPGDDLARVLVFSPDGTKLFSGFSRGSAMIWDVRRGKNGSVAGK